MLMNINIQPETLDRIGRINWFSDLFSDSPVQGAQVGHIYVQSWAEVKKFHLQMEWGWATNEAANELRFHIGANFPNLFQTTWNEMVDEVKPLLNDSLAPMYKKAALIPDLNKEFMPIIKWNVLFAMMENVYRETNPPLFFSSELLNFYEAGRLPCGWMGEHWPTGRLIVA